MISAGMVATAGGASTQDDEWFGEGSAFDSGEDLAAALFALAGTTRGATTAVPQPEIIWPEPVPAADPVFEEVQRPAGLEGARRPGSQYGSRATSASPGSWSVRSPASSCSLRRCPVEAAGRSATASPCCTGPRMRSPGSARMRWPWRSSLRPKHAAVDVPHRWNVAATHDSRLQRSYWRSRSSTCELVSEVRPAAAPLAVPGASVAGADALVAAGESPSDRTAPSSSRRRIIA